MKTSFLSLLLLLSLVACSPKEEESEPDLNDIVLAEEEEWSTGDRKTIAHDLPDPQEQIILESPKL